MAELSFGTEWSIYPLRNMDHINRPQSLGQLEKASPCETFIDLHCQLSAVIERMFLEALERGSARKTRLYQERNLEQVEQCRKDMKSFLCDNLGGIPKTGEIVPFTVTGRIQREGYCIEKVIFQSRPHVYVTSNLYIPDGLTHPTGAVLFVCGHARSGKAYPEYQRVCQLLVKAGMIVLAMDSLGQGERCSYINPKTGNEDIEWGCPEHDFAGAQCLMHGDSAARYFVHDAMRALDFLEQHPLVDKKRIGVTGNSGGGTLTGLLMLLDDRIAAAAPGTFVTSMEYMLKGGIPQDAEQVWKGMIAHGWDHDDFLIAMAPRPVLVLSVKSDYFPLEGTKECVQSAQRFYELYGQPQNLEWFVDNAEHAYTPALAHAAATFFTKHLLGKGYQRILSEDTRLDEDALNCTQTGQVRTDFPQARFIFEEQCEHAKTRGIFCEKDKQESIQWLRNKVFQNRKNCPIHLCRFGRIQIEDVVAECLVFHIEKDLCASALYFHSGEFDASNEVETTIAVWEGGTTNLQSHYDLIMETCRKGQAVLVPDILGYGPMAPNRILCMSSTGFEGTNYTLNNDLFWLDDSLFAMRVYQLNRMMEMVRQDLKLSDQYMVLHGEGFCGAYLAAAVALEQQKKKKCEFVNYPQDWQKIVQARLYNSFDIFSRLFPDSLMKFDFSDLKKWAEEMVL